MSIGTLAEASSQSFDPFMPVWLIWAGVSLMLLHATLVGRTQLLIRRTFEPVDRVVTLIPIALVMFVCWLIIAQMWVGVYRDTQVSVPTPAQTAIQVLTAQAIPAAIGLWLMRKKASRDLIGLRKSGIVAGVMWGLLGITIALPIVWWTYHGTLWVWDYLQYAHAAKHAILQQMDKHPGWRVQTMLVVNAVVIAPIFEELLFRGLLQSSLRKIAGLPWIAVLLSSLAFAIVHEPWTAPPIFVLAVLLGCVYEMSRNLWAVIVMHAAFNAFSIMTRAS